ncbi:hypothetical protein [Natrinema salifodinae]|uniref:Uncharacterized protein n=1 Tax=Natrinema salifodinae TaxID=1202768 RepID=A0A1I0P779_9EURY|nr:hypothetical protein [Natrinema salifodinae]SEW10057.1 hypothetical protein SAMN05216285_2218 [Natrinema salifodinae]
MSVQDPTDETVTTDEPTQIDDTVLERRSWNYAYIGEDVEGRHHHVDCKLERIIVTKARADRNDSGVIPVFTLVGPLLHTCGLADHPEADDADDGLAIWIEFVREEIGWDEHPVSAVDQAADILEGVFR